VQKGSPFITPVIKGSDSLFWLVRHIFCKRDMSLANQDLKSDSLRMASRFYYQNTASEAVGPVGLQELLVARAAGEIQDDLICPEGQSQWAKFESLFPARQAIQRAAANVVKDDRPAKVTVVDVDMPFLSMVGFMVKLAVAAVPAMIILFGMGLFFLFAWLAIASLVPLWR
jgi:hypothetical protein